MYFYILDIYIYILLGLNISLGQYVSYVELHFWPTQQNCQLGYMTETSKGLQYSTVTPPRGIACIQIALTKPDFIDQAGVCI